MQCIIYLLTMYLHAVYTIYNTLHPVYIYIIYYAGIYTYCKHGPSWIADYYGNCYKFITLDSAEQLLSACRDIGAHNAVINLENQKSWLYNFRLYSKPVNTMFGTNRAITGECRSIRL